MIGQSTPPIIVTRLFNYSQQDSYNLSKRKTLWKRLLNMPVIQPDSWVWIIWRLVLTNFILFFIFDITLLLTFGREFWLDEKDSVGLRIYYFVGVGVLAFDVFLEFHVGFYQAGVLQKSRKDIFQKKVLVVLLIDVLTSVILVLSYFIYSTALSWLKVVFFIKFVRLREISREFKDICLMHRRMRMLYQLGRITLIFIIFCHIIGCIFYGVDLLLYTNVPYYVDNQYLWIINIPAFPGLYAQKWNIRYLYAYYWAVTSTSTVGYGDIYPKNPMGNLLVIISNIGICIIFGLFARTVINAFQDYNQVNRNLQHTIRSLKTYFKVKRIARELSQRIRRFVQFKILLEGLQDPRKFEDFKGKLSPLVHEKLCYTMYKHFLNDIPLISGQSNLASLATQIRQANFFEGQILNPTDSQYNLIYLRQGYVSVYYQLSRSVYETKLVHPKQKIRSFEYFTGHSSQKFCKFISHSEVLILDGPFRPGSSIELRERVQQMKMELTVYKNTRCLELVCSICEQNHLQHECNEMFFEKSYLLFRGQFLDNERQEHIRKAGRKRQIYGITTPRVRPPLQIDEASNFRSYYPGYNLQR